MQSTSNRKEPVSNQLYCVRDYHLQFTICHHDKPVKYLPIKTTVVNPELPLARQTSKCLS